MAASSTRSWETLVSAPFPLRCNISNTASHAAQDELDTIAKAQNAFLERTNGCIRWTERGDGDDDFVAIKNDDDGCVATVGRRGGEQR